MAWHCYIEFLIKFNLLGVIVTNPYHSAPHTHQDWISCLYLHLCLKNCLSNYYTMPFSLLLYSVVAVHIWYRSTCFAALDIFYIHFTTHLWHKIHLLKIKTEMIESEFFFRAEQQCQYRRRTCTKHERNFGHFRWSCKIFQLHIILFQACRDSRGSRLGNHPSKSYYRQEHANSTLESLWSEFLFLPKNLTAQFSRQFQTNWSDRSFSRTWTFRKNGHQALQKWETKDKCFWLI